MALKTIKMVQTFNAPVTEVFAALSDHETFGKICGINVTRIQEGAEQPNGLGSIRKLSIGPLPSFQETITDFKENELIEYKITQGSPIKNHVGRLSFSTQGDMSVLHYTIDLESKIPLTSGLIKAVLERGISQGLQKYAQRVAS